MKKLATYITATVIGCSLSASSVLGAPVFPRSMDHVFGPASHMSFGGHTGVPRGYFDLCRHGSSVCRASAGRVPVDRSGAVKLTGELARQLRAINDSVNRSIRPVADAPGRDRWTVGGARGDCEDYAITKKQALLREGWPSSALVVALARTRGQQHALLIVRTSAGDFALDNLRNGIVGWNRTGYRYEKVQSPRDMWVWHRL